MAYFEPTRWRFTHFVHHGNTYSTTDPYDHEIEYDNNLKDTPKKLIMNIIPFGELLFFKKSIAFEVIQHAFSFKTKVMIDSIPENARPRAILISRIYVVIWLSIILWSLVISSWLPILFLLLPHYYGKGLHKLVAFTQHAGLARDVKDHRLSARDMKLNPILSFLYWKMEYHCVHHMFPTVPAYNLEKLHHHLKDQLPEIKNGLVNTYKEIIPALKKQKDEPNYHLNIALPNQQTS
jgi:fatty acid desaturase